MVKKEEKKFSNYLAEVQRLRPSAEVMVTTVDEAGKIISEDSAEQAYLELISSDEVQTAIAEIEESVNNAEKPATKMSSGETMRKTIDLLSDDSLTETVAIDGDAPQPSDIDILPEPETVIETVIEPEVAPEPTQISKETLMILEAFTALVAKIDELQNREIHIPAPVITVTLPETRKTITKMIERDDRNLIKSVTESITEIPESEPIIEVVDAAPAQTKRKNTTRGKKQ
jgi:hypothetical protein